MHLRSRKSAIIFFQGRNLISNVFRPPEDAKEREAENLTEEASETDKLMAENEVAESKEAGDVVNEVDQVEVRVVSPKDEPVQANGTAGNVETECPSALSKLLGIATPIMFEGESDHSLLRPKFLNPLLENQYKLSYFSAEVFR